jgi:hypothetical protein
VAASGLAAAALVGMIAFTSANKPHPASHTFAPQTLPVAVADAQGAAAAAHAAAAKAQGAAAAAHGSLARAAGSAPASGAAPSAGAVR